MKKILTKYEAYDKTVHALLKESNKIWKKSYYEGEWIKLEKPIKHGWWHTVEMRPDIARSPLGPHVKKVIELCVNQKSWVRFKKRRFSKKQLKRYRHLNEDHPIRFRSISKEIYDSLPRATQKLMGRVYNPYTRQYDIRSYEPNIPHFYLVSKFHRCWITERRIPNSELDSRSEFIDTALNREPLRQRKYRIYKYKNYYWNNKLLQYKEDLWLAQEQLEIEMPHLRVQIG